MVCMVLSCAVPCASTPTRILAGDHWEYVFLLSGDDLQVHMYREVQEEEVGRIYCSVEFSHGHPPFLHRVTVYHRS